MIKKTHIFIILFLISIFILGCDPRQDLSEQQLKDTLIEISNVVTEDDSWEANYYYKIKEAYLININGEIFFKKINETDQQNGIIIEFDIYKSFFINVFSNYIDKMQLTGWNDIGSYKTIIIRLIDQRSNQNEELLISEFSCRIINSGELYIYFHNKMKEEATIKLLVDEKELKNLIK